MAQGHLIPMVDIAKLIAEQGVTVTIVTTPFNASRFERIINRAIESKLPIRLLELRFPCKEVGLPERCESLDIAPSRNLITKFFTAVSMLQQPLEEFLKEQEPRPSCIISDICLSWTSETAIRFQIPRLVFHGTCCFSLLCSHNVLRYNAHERVTSDSELFMIPGLPQEISITKAQLPGAFVPSSDLDDIRSKMRQAEAMSYGVVVNSAMELELGFIEEYKRATQKKIWCIGPVSHCNQNNLDKYERGNVASIDETEILTWLDARKPKSVLYACLGSQCRLVPSQLIEICLGLEASSHSFVFVIRHGNGFSEFERWLKEGFEERIKGKSLLIKGWAPQLLILSHTSIGGFLTHCGWNSTLEGICAGVPLLTWPLFAEQFLNEKLVVQVLGVGVSVGVSIPVRWGDEEKVGVSVTQDQLEKAVRKLMEEGDKREERRKRVGELGAKVRMSAAGGSSYINTTLLIEDILDQATQRNQNQDSI
ncbi:hypothetical protein Sjap_013674 [Stephania japonica]|uniref:Glycosyltransferase n=1 Tax=Stephania japonica TaxID=461633 RepID=A0AAP0NXW4_9MAGN